MHDEAIDCRREAAWLASLERVFANRELRQELLWYRAMEKRDARTRRGLEAYPSIQALAAQVRDSLPGGLTARQTRAYYGLLFDRRLQSELGGWEIVECSCPACRRPPLGLN
jgi:hypothetical protein